MDPNSSGTILVVDDTPLLRKMVCVAIAPLKLTILTAENAEEALNILVRQRGEVDVVITDVVMPGMSGTELIDKIHALHPEMPVILMTAFSNIETLIEAIQKKAFDLILKPIDQEVLIQSVEKAFKHVRLLYLEQNYLNTLHKSVEDKTGELQMKMTELEQSRAAQATEHEKLKTLFAKVALIKQEWEMTMDCIGDMVLLVDHQDRIRRCNRSTRDFSGKTYQELLGLNWRNLFDNSLIPAAGVIPAGTELHHAATERWFEFNFYPFSDFATDSNQGNVITIIDTTERKLTMAALEKAYQDLKTTQAQVLHTEKMASIGQLAAGVAHEINNPIGFVTSNIHTLAKYQERLSNYITAQCSIFSSLISREEQEKLDKLRAEMRVDHILADSGKLIVETLDGTERIRKFVMDLKTFSRTDQGAYQSANLITCIESAINIVWNELKYKITLIRDFAPMPLIKCYPQQLNQVFVNLLVNASHAIKDKGTITIATQVINNTVSIIFSDSGCGIAEEHLAHIFEPFFTTKEVGRGTGLGLSISYDIIKKHHGEIYVQTEIDKGTSFSIILPLLT